MVPGRECGSCGVCCEIPCIDDVELQKPAGAVCTHFDKITRCTIYRTRPQACRDYYCGWRTMANLDGDWRPDRSGVFITDVGEDASEQIRARGAIKLVIDSARAVVWPAFVDFICTTVGKGIPVYLAVPGPVGHHSAKVLANTDLTAAVRGHDMQRAADVIAGLLKGLTSFANKAPPMAKNH